MPKRPSPMTRNTVRSGRRRSASGSKNGAGAVARASTRRRTPAAEGAAAKDQGVGRTLLVVESPAKARTIKKYVGHGYDVKPTVGHVRDLPEKSLGVDVEHEFEPTYQTIPRKAKVVRELRAAARKADAVVMATDPDREGEAIAWHVAEELDVPAGRIRRAVFHEITRPAVLEALRNPTAIDEDKVNAQQARRILDRLVGYQVSPLLWKVFYPGLSAGRVQTVALRLICEREEEIERFVTTEYWSIAALLDGDGRRFTAELFKLDGQDPVIGSEAEANAVLEALGWRSSEADATPSSATIARHSWQVAAVEEKERRRNPAPPFITSTLQQDASRRFGFGAKKTMRIAQELYEGLELGGEGAVGLITYMRTDSTRVSAIAVEQARGYVTHAYGAEYVPEQPRQYRSGKGAQEAHEAIRPTDVSRRPEDLQSDLSADQKKLYTLVWQRFVASQMASAVYDQTTVDFFPTERHQFRARGSVLKFPGFVRIYEEALSESARGEDQAELPRLRDGDAVDLIELTPSQHFTQPPPRFSEATLVKELESDGIGRPSTYAAIISTLLDRDYVRLERRRLFPTLLGREVLKTLVHNLEDVFNVEFTSEMEGELDKVEEGRLPWVDAVRGFYRRFQPHVAKGKKLELPPGLFRTDEACETCGNPMVVKWTKRGPFLGCSAYPKCRSTKPLFAPGEEPDLDQEKCPRCGGDLEARSGRFGPYVACANAPDCAYRRTLKGEPTGDEPTDQTCPTCGNSMVIRTGRFGRFIACTNYPACKTTKPIGIGLPCPKDGGELVERRTKKGKTFWGCANYPACDFATWNRPVRIQCPSCAFEAGEELASRKSGLRVRCLKCQQPVEATAPALV